MQSGHSRRLAGCGLLCVTVTLTGCTGSSQPAPTFTPTFTFSDPRGTGSPAPSTTVATTGPNVRPGEKPPVLPPVARTNTALGATEFAKFWMEALDWGYATTDSTLARAYFAPSCTDCTLFMRNFDGPRAVGQHFRGGRIHVLDVLIAPNDRRNGATGAIDVALSADALETVDSQSNVIDRARQVRRIVFRLWLRWTGGRWTVVQKGRVTS
jgi:hypothetical protein